MRRLGLAFAVYMFTGLAVWGDGPAAEVKPSPSMSHPAAAPARPPTVFWKRSMTPAAALPLRSDPFPPAAALVPPEPPMTRERMLETARGIQRGASRAHVFATLGRPAYSIAIPDYGHYVQRCRFRFGTENLASIEFRDGIVSAIDTTTQ